MKLSVSVPDDLWQEAGPEEFTGPSEMVQRALRLLAADRRARSQPLANAPNRTDLDRYRESFEQAVGKTTAAIQTVLDKGYRLGLLIAPFLTALDFEALDSDEAATSIRHLFQSWATDGGVFSPEFAGSVQDLLNEAYSEGAGSELRAQIDDLLGDWTEMESGVRWQKADDEFREVSEEVPVLSATYVGGLLDGLRDVRDEALRRIHEQPAERIHPEGKA